MSFFSRIFTGPSEARIINKLESVPSPLDEPFFRGDSHGSHGAMALGAFYACVTLLADTVASLSIDAYRKKGNVRVPVDPQPKLLASTPYPGLTWFDWLWMLMESLAVTGNAFGYITSRGPDGRPAAIMPVHPDCIHVTTSERNGWLEPVYRIDGKIVDNDRIMHIKRYPIAGCVVGMSPIEKAASAIGLGLAAERYGLSWFRDAADPRGILASDADLTPDQVKQTQKQWIQSHHGRRLPAVMSAGIKWQSISITPNESQFLETRGFQRSEIAMWFRIPPHMIGDTEKSTSWGTGIEQQSIGFVTYTLLPWLTCIEQALTAFLPNGQFVKFNHNGLLRGDVKSRFEAYQIGIQNGIYSPNDARSWEDLPPIPEGDIHLQPMNFVPLGYMPPEAPAQEPQPNSATEGNK
ncbi:portal protein [Mycobacterium phage DmpstrDiver]|nr:portal protein [Mycobacterium phage DmpstrDiver]